jgi:RimJ/RimL family protein N-acetyltransferase
MVSFGACCACPGFHIKKEAIMKYFEKMSGERIYLSPLSAEDAEIFAQWMNRKQVAENLNAYSGMYTLQGERDWISNSSEEHNYTIVLREGDVPIGTISLMKLRSVSRRGELGIFIGDPGCWDRGFGSEAITLLLEYGFQTLGLHSVYLSVLEGNLRARKCYLKSGFKETGRYRDGTFRNGRFEDLMMMDILSEEFKGGTE